ncbi:hypothetical protein R3P38DRAFT_3168850 [Favolaschia claudopus]|uniref:F-box domain-containing protein n=1 Tax=Favolaschia claudopus TaxID=2862362 RepID=A0AAW0E0H7_9AGAR
MDSQTPSLDNIFPEPHDQVRANWVRNPMEEALKGAAYFKQVLQAQAQDAPNMSIGALPNEILMWIFTEAVKSLDNPHEVQRERTFYCLLAVCRGWRELVLSMPELWCVVSVDTILPADQVTWADEVPAWKDYFSRSRPRMFSNQKQIKMIPRQLLSSGVRPLIVKIGDNTGEHASDALAALAPAADRITDLELSLHLNAPPMPIPMCFAGLQRLQLYLSSRGDYAPWPTIDAPALTEFHAAGVPDVPHSLDHIPLVNLTVLQLQGPSMGLKCDGFVRVLAKTPQLVQAHAVVDQRKQHSSDDEPAGVFPQVPPLIHLKSLLLELQPRLFEEWERDPQPWLEALTLPALETMGIPELLFDPDARRALADLFHRSNKFPAKLLVTASPPGEYHRLTAKYREAFPMIQGPEEERYSYIDDIMAGDWKEAYVTHQIDQITAGDWEEADSSDFP